MKVAGGPWLWVGGAVAVMGLMAGCSGGSSSSSVAVATTIAPTTTTGPTTTVTTAAASTSTTSTTSSSAVSPAVVNEPVTDAIRSQLLDAGAALNQLPPSDYTGLQPGQTYYAYDSATSTYWAGAALVPSPSSQQAQVSDQDDGSYLVFMEPAGGTWTAYDAGYVGPDSTCAETPPAAVLALWGWLPGTCHPNL